MREFFLVLALYLSSFNAFSTPAQLLDGAGSANIFKLSNSSVMLSLHKDGKLYILNDGDKKWREITIEKCYAFENVYISERNYIDVIAKYDDQSGESVTALYESRDKGESWVKIRIFTKKFCGNTTAGFLATDSLIYNHSGYTAKYDSSDDYHQLVFDGRGAFVSFRNELDALAVTSETSGPIYKPSSVFISRDGGVNWMLKGTVVPHTFAEKWEGEKPIGPLSSEKIMRFVSENKIVYGGIWTHDGYILLKVLSFKNGVYSDDADYDLRHKREQFVLGSDKLILVTDTKYLLSINTDILLTVDGGKNWATVSYSNKNELKNYSDVLLDDFNNLYFVASSEKLPVCNQKSKKRCLFITSLSGR